MEAEMRPFKAQVDGVWIAFWPTSILENGWEPFNQPHHDAYLPLNFEQVERFHVHGGVFLVQKGVLTAERLRFKAHLQTLLRRVEAELAESESVALSRAQECGAPAVSKNCPTDARGDNVDTDTQRQQSE